MLVTSAKIPMLVDDCSTRCSAFVIRPSSVSGKSCWRSRKMLSWRSGLWRIWLAMKRPSSASGKSDSSRL
jgi:hypothetical protein